MADVFQKAKRSDIMSRVRSSGNKSTELALIEIFNQSGIHGWRRKADVFGNPDFIFRKKRVAVFVDGCFWHGCRVHCTLPVSNVDYWEKKIARNKTRAVSVNRRLKSNGWIVVRLWEHDLDIKRRVRLIARLKRFGLEPDAV